MANNPSARYSKKQREVQKTKSIKISQKVSKSFWRTETKWDNKVAKDEKWKTKIG